MRILVIILLLCVCFNALSQKKEIDKERVFMVSMSVISTSALLYYNSVRPREKDERINQMANGFTLAWVTLTINFKPRKNGSSRKMETLRHR